MSPVDPDPGQVDVDAELDSMLDEYLRQHRSAHGEYLSTLEDITDYLCGVHNEVKAPDGPPYRYKFDDHQWTWQFPSRTHVVNDLAHRFKYIDTDARRFKDFEELYEYVEAVDVEYFGETARYDFALRYAWNVRPDLLPERYVYIHTKPRRSAQRLYEIGVLPHVERRLPLSDYSRLLRPGMTAYDVEHFLCIYHDRIEQLARRCKKSTKKQ